MAIFHHLFSKIARGGHTCVTATAAYRSGSLLKLKTKFTNSGEVEEFSFDFSTKPGIAYSEIMLPFDAPEILSDREHLWQLVEDLEDAPNGELACESVFAIPEELSLEQNIELIKELVTECYTKKGMLADINIHNDHANNPHVHIMSPLKFIKANNENDIIFSDRFSDSFIQEHILNLEQNFEKFSNKSLELLGYPPLISRTVNGIPRYDQLRPWL